MTDDTIECSCWCTRVQSSFSLVLAEGSSCVRASAKFQFGGLHLADTGAYSEGF